MNVLVVGDDEGVFMFNPKTKMELVKFNVQAKAACIIGDEIICSHKEKPILYRKWSNMTKTFIIHNHKG